MPPMPPAASKRSLKSIGAELESVLDKLRRANDQTTRKKLLVEMRRLIAEADTASEQSHP